MTWSRGFSCSFTRREVKPHATAGGKGFVFFSFLFFPSPTVAADAASWLGWSVGGASSWKGPKRRTRALMSSYVCVCVWCCVVCCFIFVGGGGIWGCHMDAKDGASHHRKRNNACTHVHTPPSP
jgi:succinate dehydrogenase/fumarate reductase cytochrome b subunit